MKLQVTQENLSKALNTVARVANTRNTLPILANVLLQTVDNRLSISATNLDIAITHRIGSKIEKTGSITAPARLMQDFVSSLPEGVLKIELSDNKLHIITPQILHNNNLPFIHTGRGRFQFYQPTLGRKIYLIIHFTFIPKLSFSKLSIVQI